MTTTAKVRLSSDSSTYSLTPADMDTFNALVRAQGYLGAAQSSVGQTQLLNFFGVIREITYDHYRFCNNAQLKTWMDTILQVITGAKTSYVINSTNVTGAGMFVLYMYYQFNDGAMDHQDLNSPPGDYIRDNGFPSGYFRNGGYWWPTLNSNPVWLMPWEFFGPTFLYFLAPVSNNSFYQAMGTEVLLLDGDVRTKAGTTDMVMIADSGHDFNQIQQFQQSRFDPANWTNSSDFVTAFAGCSVWQDQKTMLKTLVNDTNMDSGSYLFILYLIMALSASNVTDQQMVQKVISTVTGSIEYANDTFMNQLVYLILIQMADPLGSFAYNNTQLKTVLTNLINAIVISNAASKITLTSLQNHLKILNSDSSYPMQDPYCPNIGFDTRQTDTIAALDQARATISL